MVHAATAQSLPERLGDVILALQLSEGRRPVPAVERERRVLRRSVNGRWLDLTVVGVTCHDLILGGEREGPLAHPPEPAYPCCLPALGGLAG